MTKTFLLTIIFLKSSLQRIESKYYENAEKSKKRRRTLYLILFIFIAGAIGVLSNSIIQILDELNQETTFIGIIFFLVLMVTFIQTIFSSVNLLYFTKDNESILPLPLKPYQIILARTNVLLFIEYILVIIVGFIPLMVYGITMDCNTMYYFTTIISLILLPILPVILVSIVVMILMCFSKITKHKNVFQLISTLIIVIATVAISVVMTNVESTTISEEQLLQMMSQANGMIDMIKGYFPTLDYSINAVLSDNIFTSSLEFLKIFGMSLVAYIIYALLSQKLYFKGLIGNLYSGDIHKKQKKIKLKKKKQGLLKVYVGKEFKTILRNPVYLAQCIIPVIIFPIMAIILVFMSMEKETIFDMINGFRNLEVTGTTLLIILGIIQIFSMVVYISVTAISRDGKNAVFMKYIPIPLYKQYIYKTIPNIIINLFPILFVLSIAKYLMNISLLDLFIIFIIAFIINVAESFLLIVVDLKRPKIQWDSEYAVVKQNINLLFPILLTIIAIVLLIIYEDLIDVITVYGVLAIIASIYLLITIITNIYLYKRQNELASKIE